MHEFLRCVREGKRPETGYEDNLKSFAMVCMAQQSLARRAPVTFAELSAHPGEC